MPFEEVGVRAVLDGVAIYERDAARVNSATQRIVTEAARAAREAQSQAQFLGALGNQMRQTGQQAALLGAALSAPGLAAIHFAVQFETAFAGVRKTVDATETEFATLRTGLLDLSRNIPTSAGGLAGIAEAAGQLGVAKQDILDFTNVTAQLAATTNLTTESAATSLARFANILQIPQSELQNVASALVDLGNKGAATESEILEISLRLAGAGKVIGLSADEVLSFGNALASLGINAEAGGSAFSRVFVEIAKAVQIGGTDLQKFAEVADQTSAQFAASFRADAAGAVIQFVEGLGRITDEGGATFQVLEDLSLGDIRLRDALLRASGAGELLRTSLQNGATAFRENTALTVEFEKRLNTTSAQFQLFLNDIQRVAISAGTVLLPTLRALIGGARELGEAFEGLPPAVQGGIAAFSLLAGGAVIAIGSLGILAGSLLAIGAAFPGLVAGVGAAASALGGLTLAAGAFAITPVGATLLAIGIAAGGAALAYRALTAESKAVQEAHDRQKRAMEELRATVDESSRAYEEHRKAVEAAVSGKQLGDAATTRATDAETAATERLNDTLRERARIQAAIRTEAAGGPPALSPGAPTPPPGPFGVPSAGQPGAPTPQGQALFAQAQALQAAGGGRGFRRNDVEEAERANFDLAKSLLGIEDPLARIDPLLLKFTRELDKNQRALLKDAANADVARGNFVKLAQAAEQQAESAGRGTGREQESGSRIAQLQAEAQRDLADAERELQVLRRAGVTDAGAIAAAELKIAGARGAVSAAAEAEVSAAKDVSAAQAELTRMRVSGTASAEELTTAQEKLGQAQDRFNAIQTAGIEPSRAYEAASREVQDALRELERVQGSGTASAAELQQAQDRVTAALRESDRVASTLPLRIGAITNSQEALAASADKAEQAQRRLNDALFRTALARSQAIPSVFPQGADQDAEAAAVGAPEDFPRFGNAGLTPEERLRILQEQGADAVRRVEEQLAAERKAAADAASAAAKAEREYRQSLAGRTQETLKQLAEQRAQARGEALFREALGIKGPTLADVEAQQARVDAAFGTVRNALLATGNEIPEALIAMFDNMSAVVRSRTEEVLANLQQSRAQRLGESVGREAFGLEGPSVSEILAQQQRSDAIFARVRDRLQELGVEVPEGLIEVFDRMAETADAEGRKKGETIGGILGFLIARRLGQGLDPGGGLIRVPPAQQAALAGGSTAPPQINFTGPVTIGAGVTTGDVAQGVGVAYRTALSQT